MSVFPGAGQHREGLFDSKFMILKIKHYLAVLHLLAVVRQ